MTENRIFGSFFCTLRVLWDHQNRLLHPKTASKSCLSTLAVSQLRYSLALATISDREIIEKHYF